MVTIISSGAEVRGSGSPVNPIGLAANSEILNLNFSTAMASTLKHDLRNPLAAIFAYTDLLLRNPSGNLTERQIKNLRAVATSAASMGDLIDHHLTPDFMDPNLNMSSPLTGIKHKATFCDQSVGDTRHA